MCFLQISQLNPKLGDSTDCAEGTTSVSLVITQIMLIYGRSSSEIDTAKELRFSFVTSSLFSGTRAPIDAERLECGGERPPENPDFPLGQDDS